MPWIGFSGEPKVLLRMIRIEPMNKALGARIVEYAVSNGLNVRNNYSGRWMFGKLCLGVVGSMPELDALLSNVKGANEGLCKDNMGLDYIYYWPSISMDHI